MTRFGSVEYLGQSETAVPRQSMLVPRQGGVNVICLHVGIAVQIGIPFLVEVGNTCATDTQTHGVCLFDISKNVSLLFEVSSILQQIF